MAIGTALPANPVPRYLTTRNVRERFEFGKKPAL